MEVDNFSVKVFLVSATLFDDNTTVPDSNSTTEETVKVKPPKTGDVLYTVIDRILELKYISMEFN